MVTVKPAYSGGVFGSFNTLVNASQCEVSRPIMPTLTEAYDFGLNKSEGVNARPIPAIAVVLINCLRCNGSSIKQVTVTYTKLQKFLRERGWAFLKYCFIVCNSESPQ